MRAWQGGQHVKAMLAIQVAYPPQVAVSKVKMARKIRQNHQICEHPRGNLRRGDARKDDFNLKYDMSWGKIVLEPPQVGVEIQSKAHRALKLICPVRLLLRIAQVEIQSKAHRALKQTGFLRMTISSESRNTIKSP